MMTILFMSLRLIFFNLQQSERDLFLKNITAFVYVLSSDKDFVFYTE